MAIDFDALVLGPLHAVFGAPCTYGFLSGAASIVIADVVVDRGYVQVGTDDGGVPITAFRTLAGVRQSAFPAGIAPVDGDRIIINGVIFQVTDQQPDGKGHVMLVLAAVT